jgi:hypothetical protein
MAIVDKKKEIMGKVGALNKLTEKGKSKFDKSKSKFDKARNFNVKDSMSSINNGNNPLEFLLELSNTLVGYKEIKDNIVDLISRRLPEVEVAIKKDLKKQIKEIVSCGVNPSIPDWFKSDGEGINIELSNVDFFGIMKCDPNSPNGYSSIIYDDTASGLNSTDFNTYLYNNINSNRNVQTLNGGTSIPWGKSTSGNDIMDVSFSPAGKINSNDTTNTTNIINFRVNKSQDDKKLTDFNEALIDSISLFGKTGSDKVLSKIVDNMFGTVGKEFGKSKEQLLLEAKIKKVIDCILNSDETSDNFYTFSNEDLKLMEKDVNNKRKGIRVLDCCQTNPVQIDPNILLQSQTNIVNADETTPNITAEDNKTRAVNDAIENLANAQAGFAKNVVDVPTIKLNFILDIIREFVYSIITFVISPKLMGIYSLNHQIVYGRGTTYDGPIDFIKKNHNLVKAIGKIILDFVILILLILVLKYLSIRLSQKFAEDEIEKAKSYANTLARLVGIPPNITSQIQNINYINLGQNQ